MNLEKWLRDYDKVFLAAPDERSEKLLSEMLCCLDRTGRRNRVLFLSLNGGMAGVKRISPEEYQALWDLYHMYECSDRFQIIADSRIYGSLLNYVDTGLLIMEEAAEMLLR